MIRRAYRSKYLSATMGRNPKAYAMGHWHVYPNDDFARPSVCRCGATEWPHEGQYADDFYAQDDFDIGIPGWFVLSAWTNNRGSFGAYYSVGGKAFRAFWRSRGKRNRFGLIISIIRRSGEKVHGPSCNWSEL